MRRRTFCRSMVALSGLATAYPRIVVGSDPPRIELALCLDSSGSMYSSMARIGQSLVPHHDLQRRGHVGALRDERVIELLVAERVLLRAVAWSQAGMAREIVGPMIIERPEDALTFADILDANTPRQLAPGELLGTYHPSALRFVLDLATYGGKQIIDISTDEGLTNDAVVPSQDLRNQAESRGVTINALAIEKAAGFTVTQSMRQSLQTSDGFTITADSWERYAEAILEKLLKELLAA